MSRSNPTVSTPAQKFFKIRGKDGALVFYDKDAEAEIEVPRPFRFVVLDRLSTIKGYNKDTKSGIWSNEVRNIKTDTLVVKMKSNIFASGQYDSIKNDLKAQGGKFTQSVYIAYQQPKGEDGDWVIGNINMAGAALGAWFDFSKTVKVEHKGIGIVLKKEVTEEENGATKFFVPQFDTFQTQEADEATFTALDTELQDYLTTYLDISQKDENGHDWKHQVETQGLTKPEDVVLEDIDDKPIDLSEIPF